MKVNSKGMLLLAGALCVLAAAGAHAAGFFTNGLPVAGGTQYPSTLPLTGAETLPADTNLTQGLNPASEAITTAQMAGYVGNQPSRGNAVIGGDATTNLWQRSTAGASSTSATPAYNGPDRFAQWSTSAGASVQVSRVATTTDTFSGYQYAMEMSHQNTTAGQICVGQEIASPNSYQFQGNTAELDFHAYLGAGYSGGSTLTAYLVYGTGTDDGIGKMAFTVNGAGTSPGFAGGATATAAVIPLSTVSTGGRYAAVANIPSTATEVGLAICYTAGTTDTNDYVDLAGVQLVRNPSNASYVSNTVGYNDTTFPAMSFERRLAPVENYYQYAYYWQLNEQTTTYYNMGDVTASSVENAPVLLPEPMRATPACTFTNGGFTWITGGTTYGAGGSVVVKTLAQGTSTNAVLNLSDTATDTAVGSPVLLEGTTLNGRIKCSAEL